MRTVAAKTFALTDEIWDGNELPPFPASNVLAFFRHGNAPAAPLALTLRDFEIRDGRNQRGFDAVESYDGRRMWIAVTLERGTIRRIWLPEDSTEHTEYVRVTARDDLLPVALTFRDLLCDGEIANIPAGWRDASTGAGLVKDMNVSSALWERVTLRTTGSWQVAASMGCAVEGIRLAECSGHWLFQGMGGKCGDVEADERSAAGVKLADWDGRLIVVGKKTTVCMGGGVIAAVPPLPSPATNAKSGKANAKSAKKAKAKKKRSGR
jgi:hypothetical protein